MHASARFYHRWWQIGQLLLFSLPLLFLAIFFFYPLLAILRLSLWGNQEASWRAIGDLLVQPFLWQVLWFTCWQALVSTALTLLAGLPLAYLFAHYTFPGKLILRSLITAPFVMPTVVVAAAFTALLGSNGLLNQWLQLLPGLPDAPVNIGGTIWGILLAHLFYNVSVVVRTVGSFWENLNPRLGEAAAMLGASPARALREITLPLLMPAILAASMLIFLFCFTSFGVVLILGGLHFATLEVEIYRQAVNLFNLPTAAFLSLFQMLFTFAIMFVYTRIQARATAPLERTSAREFQRGALALSPQTVLIIVACITVLLLAPLLALAWRSFTLGGQGFTLRYYLELAINRRQSAFFVPPIMAIRNSLLYAVATVCISLLIGVAAAYLLTQPRPANPHAQSTLSVRLLRLLDPIFLLPLGTSAVTLGFGYIIAMGPLRTSLLLTPLAHALIAAPFVLRTFLPALRSMDQRLREAAGLLGAAPPRVWWEIDAPLLLPSLVVGAVYAFTISLGEFGATLLISRPDFPTMPVVIYQALSRPGLLNYGQALAMSTLLMLVSVLSLSLIERFRMESQAEF
ncbi:MAG: iron ABC transporter permease [Caldilineaceae bacterium]